MSKQERPDDVDVIAQMATALSDSTRYLIDKSESMDRTDVDRLRHLVRCLAVLLLIAILSLIVAGWFFWSVSERATHSSTLAMEEALEANTRARTEEMTRAEFQEDQEKFNETVLQAFEEIKKKWTQSPTRPKH